MTDEKQADTVLKVKCEVYSRVVGYLRPVSAFNAGKQQEHADRVPFAVPPVSGLRGEVSDA